MTDDAKSIRALRRYYKDRDSEKDAAAFFAEIDGESDRASVILMATSLADLLAIALEACMRGFADEKERARMFDADGPLSTFSARIEMAYQFEIIDDRARQSLHIIREMRNACAHSEKPISFETPEVAAVCKRLFAPRGHKRPRDETTANLRAGFKAEALFLYQIILHGSRDAAAEMLEQAAGDDDEE